MEITGTYAPEQTIFELLQADHRAVLATLDRLLGTSASDEADRLNLIMALRDLLVPHTAAEEQLVYPLLDKEHAWLHAVAADEHHAMRVALQAALQLPVQDQAFPVQVAALREMTVGHVTEEEGPVFEALQSQLSEAEALQVADAVTHFKQHFELAQSGRLAA